MTAVLAGLRTEFWRASRPAAPPLTRAAAHAQDLPLSFAQERLWFLEELDPGALEIYAGMCGASLARAHARSGDPIAISAYLGAGKSVAGALVQFAKAYADQNESDHARFVEHRDRVLDERVDPDPVGVRRTLAAAHPPVVPGQHADATVLA